MQRLKRGSQESIVQPCGMVLIPPQGIYVFKLYKLSAFFIPMKDHLSYTEEQNITKHIKKINETTLEEYRSCTHPTLVSDPTLELLL